MKKPARGTAIALLRGINVGGNKKVPMAELRELAIGVGCHEVASYIQSGNLVFSTELAAGAVEVALERAIERHFGFSVGVIVRTGEHWQGHATGSPFADAEEARPHLLLLQLSKQPPKPGAVEALRAYAKAGERIAVRGDGIWIDFGSAIASSKLSPAVLDRLVGSTVTARNWRTVQQLARMAADAALSPVERVATPSRSRKS